MLKWKNGHTIARKKGNERVKMAKGKYTGYNGKNEIKGFFF